MTTNTHDHGNDQSRSREGYETAREATLNAPHKTTETIGSDPLAIVIGGIAAGALAGALLPRSNREKELLAPLGKRLGDTARVATQAAREAGMTELEGLGLTKDAARGQAKTLLDGVVKAIGTAGSAAAKAAANKSGTPSADQGSN